MPINIISLLKPKNDGEFPIAEDVDGYGGYQVRSDITDRNLIPELNRIEGMLVYVQSDAKYYTLSGGITNSDWIEVTLGGGSTTTREIVVLTEPTTYNVPSGVNQFIINTYVPTLDDPSGVVTTVALPSDPTDLQEIIVKTTNASGKNYWVIDVNGGINNIDNGNADFGSPSNSYPWIIYSNYCLKIRWTGSIWSVITFTSLTIPK